MTTENLAHTDSTDIRQRRKSRMIFIAIIAFFAVPYFVVPHIFNLDKMGTTNKGQLIQPHVNIDSLNLKTSSGNTFTSTDTAGQWSLLYFIPQACDQICKNALFSMRQVRKSLDKDIDRVRLISVHSHAQTKDLQKLISTEFPLNVQLEGQQQQINSAFANTAISNASEANQIYILSPDGYIFIHYPVVEDVQEAILKARDIRKDLKKTLKGSLIG